MDSGKRNPSHWVHHNFQLIDLCNVFNLFLRVPLSVDNELYQYIIARFFSCGLVRNLSFVHFSITTLCKILVPKGKIT